MALFTRRTATVGEWLCTRSGEEVTDSLDLSSTSLNNTSGPASEPDAYAVFDLTGFYEITENFSINAAVYNLANEVFFRWDVLNSVRLGTTEFFGGVTEDGIRRYSEPGGTLGINLNYSF